MARRLFFPIRDKREGGRKRPRSGSPTEPTIEVAMDMIAVLDSWGAQGAALGTLQLHLMISTKPFQHGIEALTRPGKQLPKTVEIDPIVAFSDTSIGRLKLLALGVRV